MRLAMSNIAWPPGQRLGAYELMVKHGASGLEIAPGLTFTEDPDPFDPTAGSLTRFQDEIADFGLTAVSMQSLLFGVQDALLFGDVGQTERFERGLSRAIALAGRLQIANLVVGSPVNRAIPRGMDRATAEQRAIDVFRRLGDLAATSGARLALEPNPAVYGTNFLTDAAETIRFVRRVGHPAVTMNFDLGERHVNGQFSEAATCFTEALAIVSHIHISEPHLAPAPQDAKGLEAFAAACLKSGYSGWFSIEMRTVSDAPLAAVDMALRASSSALRRAEGNAK